VIVGDYYGEKNIVIVDGLNKGDRVVVDGALKVIPGQPVKIVAAGEAGAVKAGEAAGKAPEKPTEKPAEKPPEKPVEKVPEKIPAEKVPAPAKN